MFGYVAVNRGELKVKDFEKYTSFYCGVCRDLKERTGQLSRATLTYDMTFLAVLLTALYEEPLRQETKRCVFHGGMKRPDLRNRYTAYAADMNLLLVYHNLMDDWIDERKKSARLTAFFLKRAYRKTAEKYPEKVRAVDHYLVRLHEVEENGSTDPDLAAGLTGDLMREIYLYRRDEWERDLGALGFYIGKFIYLRDAYDDLEKDLGTGNYNPFRSFADHPEYDSRARGILMMQAASAARAFERLPIVEHVDILRNVLYTGIWTEPERRGRCGKIKNDTGSI